MSSSDADAAKACPVTGQTLTLTGRETRIDPLIRNNPFPFYKALREQDPVYYDPGIDVWLVSRYEDVKTRSPTRSSTATRTATPTASSTSSPRS
jgi:hypothetical protein